MDDCDDALSELDVFLDGELSEAARKSVDAHLGSCSDCLGAFDFHAELRTVIAAKCRTDEIPADLIARIERCLGEDLDGDGRIG